MAFLPKPSESTGDFIVPEPGVYTLEFVRFEGPRETTYEGKTREVIDLFFEIMDDDEYAGVELKRTCGWTMHKTRSTLYPIVCALFGREIADDEDANLEDVIGTQVDGTIVNTSKPSRNDPSKTMTFANIDAIAKKRGRRRTESSENPFKEDKAA